MVLKLNKVSVISLASILAVLHAIVGVILGVIVTIGALFNQENEGVWGLGAWAMIVLPVLNAALGFLTGAFLAGMYNLIVQWLGKSLELEFGQEEAVTLKQFS